MKILITALALTAANIASAAPQTIYFAGNIYDGRVVDSSTQAWVQAPVGGAFYGSITYDGAKGALEYGSQGNYFEVKRSTLGSAAESIVSSFTFNYGGVSYERLPQPFESQGDWSSVTKTLGQYEFDDQFNWGPRSSGYRLGSGSSVDNISDRSGLAYRSYTSRSLGLSLQGGVDLVGDAFDLENPPNLDLFDPANSEIYFSESSFTCAYAQDACSSEAVFGDGGLNLFGRLSYLSTKPLLSSEVPEPGSLALVMLGIVGLASLRRRNA